MTDDQRRGADSPVNGDEAGRLPGDEAGKRQGEERAAASAAERRAAATAREVGYRGSLAPREDRIARAWVLTVVALFLLVLVLSALGIPSRLVPEETPLPIPSFSLPPVPVPSGSVPASAP